MDSQTYTTFFALLALACNAATLALAVIWVGQRYSTRLAEVRQQLAESATSLLTLGWIIVLGAMLGSLYYSEVAHFEPCRLCWYQRITMYPLVAVLLVGLVRRELTSRFYAYPLVAAGTAISAYHWLIQQFPDLDSGACSVGIPCSLQWVEKFGFISIPYMAFSGFTAIGALLLVAAGHRRDDRSEVPAASGVGRGSHETL